MLTYVDTISTKKSKQNKKPQHLHGSFKQTEK